MPHAVLTPTVLSSGHALVECPRWHDGRIWFADWGAGEILKVEEDGRAAVVARAPAPPLSFDFLPDGRMLIVNARELRLYAREADGRLTAYADLPRGLGNEIVVDGRGGAYVNGAGFDMMAGETPKPGGVALVRPDGTVSVEGGGLEFPNGMAVTPDNRTLIVAESWGRRLTAFDIAEDGTLSRQRVWADLADGAPDGICVDADGCVWYADVPNRHCRRVREGGEVLAEVPLDRGGFACMLGGPKRRTLYITAAQWRGVAGMADMAGTGQLLAVDVETPGAGWP